MPLAVRAANAFCRIPGSMRSHGGLDINPTKLPSSDLKVSRSQIFARDTRLWSKGLVSDLDFDLTCLPDGKGRRAGEA
jgi:hypothetical protein